MPYDASAYLCDTDLASERLRADKNDPAVSYEREAHGDLFVTRITVREGNCTSPTLSPGRYLTVEYPTRFEACLGTSREALLPALISSLLPPPSGGALLVVGIGNPALTADAVGPRAVEGIYATPVNAENGVIVLSPGTEEAIGLPHTTLLRACTEIIKPHAVLLIDALATRSSSRLLSTIQLTDTGITPGSGIRQGRAPLNRETLGCPVVALGVPTVISSRALIRDLCGENARHTEGMSPLWLSAHDNDIAVTRAAALIANAVNRLTNMF